MLNKLQIFSDYNFNLETRLPAAYSGEKEYFSSSNFREIISPNSNQKIAEIGYASNSEVEEVINNTYSYKEKWAVFPAPKRGEIIRQIGLETRKYKTDLATIISAEMGKPIQEALGEVQEMIDICDYCTGLSRMLYGKVMPSEREGHKLLEQYHPLGVVGIITAFNFPIAVWSWNAMVAMACGNVCVWKPSEKAPLIAIAIHKIAQKVLTENGISFPVISLLNGDKEIGEPLVSSNKIALVSATGSTRMGKEVQSVVAQRLGKTLLELGGNNAAIVTPNADLNIAIPAIVFGAIGNTGQRCTTTRRVIVHKDVFEELEQKLLKAYGTVKVGESLDATNHMGPLIDVDAVNLFQNTIREAEKQGGKVLIGGNIIKENFVEPTVIKIEKDAEVLLNESFVPILYLVKYEGDIKESIRIQNNVSQGLSSSIFTENMKEMELFLSANGSDCGIANINAGTSGAEIGGAFGGEKDTGGGRESGSDSWKQYMRRQTVTINYSNELPLSQGIKFDL